LKIKNYNPLFQSITNWALAQYDMDFELEAV